MKVRLTSLNWHENSKNVVNDDIPKLIKFMDDKDLKEAKDKAVAKPKTCRRVPSAEIQGCHMRNWQKGQNYVYVLPTTSVICVLGSSYIEPIPAN